MFLINPLRRLSQSNLLVCIALGLCGWNGLKTESISLPRNEWTHICGVFSQRQVKLYINGILRTASTDWSTHKIKHSSQAPLHLGLTRWARYESPYGFSGYMKDAKIWNCSRTEQQIRDSLANGSVDIEMELSNLLLWLPLNRNCENFLQDRGPHKFLARQCHSDCPVQCVSEPPDSPKVAIHIPVEIPPFEETDNEKPSAKFLHFSRTDSGIMMPHHESLNPRRAVTVECRLYCTELADLPTWAVYIAKITESWDKTGYGLIAGATGTVSFFVNGWNGQATPATPLRGGIWTHICGVFADGDAQLYIDGEVQYLVRGEKTIKPNMAPIRSGYCTYENGPTSYGFRGSIQDIRIWKCARSLSQIRENMVTLSVSDRNSEDLLCWLPLGSSYLPLEIPLLYSGGRVSLPISQLGSSINGEDFIIGVPIGVRKLVTRRTLHISGECGLRVKPRWDHFAENNLTIECWFLMYQHSFEKTVFLSQGVYGTGFALSFINDRISLAVCTQDIMTTVGIQKGYWVHICYVYESGLHKLYVNGECASSTTMRSPLSFDPTSVLHIGKSPIDYEPPKHFKGFCRDVRLWSCVRTPEQIKFNLHRLSGNHQNLEVWLPLGSNGYFAANQTHFLSDVSINSCVVECIGSVQALPLPVPPSTVPWELARLLFIGKLKNDENENCYLRNLPLDVIIKILAYL
ncbi:hypothetical protein Pelo_10893 [Pelomyxa schiedti]|nr:hypothetical protein Pelo_10893 [Pelomyxa schiedti]